MKKEFGINVISTACAVMPHTIRTWEKRYQVFTPERSEGGHRLYSEDDLAKAKPPDDLFTFLAIFSPKFAVVSDLAFAFLLDCMGFVVLDDVSLLNLTF